MYGDKSEDLIFIDMERNRLFLRILKIFNCMIAEDHFLSPVNTVDTLLRKIRSTRELFYNLCGGPLI